MTREDHDAMVRAARRDGLKAILGKDGNDPDGRPFLPLEDVLAVLEETHGFAFPDALRHFSEKQGPVAKQYATYAREHYTDEGEHEFDEVTMVSLSSDRGAYVLSWQWVDAEEAGVTWHEQEKEMVE